MPDSMAMIVGLAVLSFGSGMLGLGVAFAAVPFLGLFLADLVHQVQPLSLILNGLTGLFSTAGFARSGLVECRRAAVLAVVRASADVSLRRGKTSGLVGGRTTSDGSSCSHVGKI